MCKHGTMAELKIKVFDQSKEITVDKCLVPLIKTLNRYGVQTLNSCCGHGSCRGAIVIDADNIRLSWVGNKMLVELMLDNRATE